MSHLVRQFTHAMYFQVFDKSHRNARHQTAFRLLPEQLITRLTSNSISVYEGLQLILDFVSGMTDRTALKTHRILSGHLTNF